MQTQRLFGLDFVTGTSIENLAAALADAAEERRHEWQCVVTPNVDHIVRYARHPTEAETARAATLVLPDGMPIVLASRLLGRPLSARLTGSDLFGELWPLLASRGIPVVVVAPNDEVAARLRETHGQVRYIVPPQFDVGDASAVAALMDQIDTGVQETGARVVVVGVSMPKHHLIAKELHARWQRTDLDMPIVMLLGASPELALGLTPRAPRWMQRWGLEWLHRLALDPGRLAKRYLIDDVAFVPLVWRQWRHQRSRY